MSSVAGAGTVAAALPCISAVPGAEFRAMALISGKTSTKLIGVLVFGGAFRRLAPKYLRPKKKNDKYECDGYYCYEANPYSSIHLHSLANTSVCSLTTK